MNMLILNVTSKAGKNLLLLACFVKFVSFASSSFASTGSPFAGLQRQNVVSSRNNLQSSKMMHNTQSKLIGLVKIEFRAKNDKSLRSWLGHDYQSSHLISSTDQTTIDEYMKFLDRRYNRLHNVDLRFAGLSWNETANAPKDSHNTPISSLIIGNQAIAHNDALYVLGVAGTAGRKLLEHHSVLTLNESKPSKRTTMDSMTKNETTFTKSPFECDQKQRAKFSPVKHLSLWCNNLDKSSLISLSLRRYQHDPRSRKLLAMILVAHSDSPLLGKLVRALWISGGGEKNLRWTVNIIVAFGYVIASKASGKL